MNATELEEKLFSDPFTRLTSAGVHVLNELPTDVVSRPRLFIVNTEPNYLPEKHWVSLYLEAEGEKAEYFDPLGDPPNATLHSFLMRNSEKGYWRNVRPVQGDDSKYCGQFCLYYSYFRCRRFPMWCILQSLTLDYSVNDYIVNRFISEIME